MTVSDLLMSLFLIEQPWAICSRCSLQKRNKSKMLLSLFKKERHEWFSCDSSKLLAKIEQVAQKICFFHVFLAVFGFFMPSSELLICSFVTLIYTAVGLYDTHCLNGLFSWSSYCMYKNNETICITGSKYCIVFIHMFLNLWNNNAFISF